MANLLLVTALIAVPYDVNKVASLSSKSGSSNGDDDSEGMASTVIVLKGERHTGTEFVDATVMKNFDVGRNGYVYGLVKEEGTEKTEAVCKPHEGDGSFACWKHGYANVTGDFECADPQADNPRAKRACTKKVLLSVTRNPYSWLTRMYCEPYTCVGCTTHSTGSFSKFLREPFRYFPLELIRSRGSSDSCVEHSDAAKCLKGGKHKDVPVDEAKTPTHLWMQKVRSYHNWTGPAVHVCQKDFESARTTKAKLVDPLRKLGVPLSRDGQKGGDPRPVDSDAKETHKRKGTYSLEGLQIAVDEETGKEQKWLGAYSQEDLDYVNSILTDEDLATCGYTRVRTVAVSEPATSEQRGVHAASSQVSAKGWSPQKAKEAHYAACGWWQPAAAEAYAD